MEENKTGKVGNNEVKPKENVKFCPNDTFTSDDGGDPPGNHEINRHAVEAKFKATPAVCKRRQATQHLVVQSPTDHIFSPCSQKLLQKKKGLPNRDDFWCAMQKMLLSFKDLHN